jgi:hypothetical protein
VTEATHKLARKEWDSDFFGREIHSLHLTADVARADLESALLELDAQCVWAIECEIEAALFDNAIVLEDLGFRLVDSRMVFISKMSLEDKYADSPPYGEFRPVRRADLARIDELTTTHLVDNPGFKSRFKNRRLFSRDESIRYYRAWNQLAFDNDPGTFVVWDVEQAVVGYFNYLRSGEYEGLRLFKGGLTAVDEPHRGRGIQNVMQGYLFNRFGVERWALDNTTQVTNVTVLKNHIRANKSFQQSTLTFYRLSAGANWGSERPAS